MEFGPAKSGPHGHYQRREDTWFLVSGINFQEIDSHENSAMRGQQVAFLNINFPKARTRAFESWVEQNEAGFRPVALRGGIPSFV